MDDNKPVIMNILKSILKTLSEINEENRVILGKLQELDIWQKSAGKELMAQNTKIEKMADSLQALQTAQKAADIQDGGRPVMTGTGFSGITVDYIKSITKK